MSTLSELFTGVRKKPFKPLPVDDPYTAQYLSGIEASGLGQRNQIASTFGNGVKPGTWLNTQNARLQTAGWGNSSLAGSYSLGNEQRRQQALLDLDNQLFAQRLQAQQAGTGAALQQFGVNTQAKQAYQNAQAQRSQANSALFGEMIKAGASVAAAPVTGGTSLIGYGLGIGGKGKSADPYGGIYNPNPAYGGQAPPFMGYA